MVRKAPASLPPCTVGIIAPASAPRTPESLEAGLKSLVSAGFTPVFKRSTFEALGYLAGTDQDRLDELNSFLRSDEVNSLFCVRGGYGTLRLLDEVDYAAARNHPKTLVGYSDITALQLALYKHAGWVSISGPMVAVEWPDPIESNCAQFLSLLSGQLAAGALDAPEYSLQVLRTGTVQGTLLGGNLSIIAKMCGSKHLPDFSGAILFLEEIGESPYRIDGLLAQLKLSGLLNKLGGIVLGGFTEADPSPGRPTLSMDAIFEHYFGDLGIPVASGLRYGHFPSKIAVPIGVEARLTCSALGAELILLEAAVG